MSSREKQKLQLQLRKQASKNQRKTIHLDLKKIIKMHEEWKKENIIAQEEGLAHSTISTILKDQRGGYKSARNRSCCNKILNRAHPQNRKKAAWIEDQIQKRIAVLLLQAKGFPHLYNTEGKSR